MDWKINLLILTYGLWLTQPQKSGVQANGLGSAPRRKNVVKNTVTNEMSSTAGQKKQTPTKPTVKIPDEKTEGVKNGDLAAGPPSVLNTEDQNLNPKPVRIEQDPIVFDIGQKKQGITVDWDDKFITINWPRDRSADWMRYLTEAKTALAVASGALVVSLITAIVTCGIWNKKGTSDIETGQDTTPEIADWMTLLDRAETRARMDQICQEILKTSDFKRDVAGIRDDLRQQVNQNSDALLRMEVELKFCKQKLTAQPCQTNRRSSRDTASSVEGITALTKPEKISLTESTSTLTNEEFKDVNLFEGRKTPDQNDSDDKVGFLYEAENPFDAIEKDEFVQTALLTGARMKTIRKNPKRMAPSPPPSRHQGSARKQRSASVIELFTDKMTKL